jgi:Cu(I)/Ag(I) efflux system membrane fusion protein
MKTRGIWITLACLGVAAAGGTGYWLGMQGVQPAQAVTAAAQNAPARNGLAQNARVVLYYRNPMGLHDTSPVPKKDSMGMDYVPVYADEEAGAGQLRISLDKVQKLGVRTEPVSSRELATTVRAVGRLQPDERRMVTITTRFEGYIEKLLVNATGQPVKRGQPLMEVYSPELVSAQEEYLIARSGQEALRNGTAESVSGADQLAEAALQRLRNWDISAAQLQRLQSEGTVTRTLTVYSPANGVVLEKTAQQGMRFMPGEILFRIADLSTVWLIADVFEQDLSLVQPGQPVKISVDAWPEQEFSGEVAYIYPTVSPQTRAVQVRVEMSNPHGLLKPDLYASVQLVSTGDTALTVPDSAVIDSGTRQVVLVQREEGLFEPREVTLGRRSDDYVEVLHGVTEGEKVVVRANFLIDAESKLQSALDGFSADAQPGPEHGGDHGGEHADAAPEDHEGH